MGLLSRKNIIFTATIDQLSCPQCYFHLWSIAVSLTHLSSTGLIAAIESLLRDAEHLGIEFRHPDGTPFIIPETTELFQEKNKSGKRWVADFREANAAGTGPYRHSRCFERLQLIELLLQCTVAKYRRGPETPRCSFTHFPLGW